MKALSAKDLPTSYAVSLFEFGYAAGNCRRPEQFKKLLQRLKDLFPADAVVCGYGEIDKNVDVTKLWNGPAQAGIDVKHVEAESWPQTFLKPYFENRVLARDAQSYECIRTEKAQLCIDVFKRDGEGFNDWTKRGLDPKFVEIVFDHGMPLVLRKTHVDQNKIVSDFSLLFRQRKEAKQFGQLWEGVVPYLHNALLRTYRDDNAQDSKAKVQLSPRQQEVLKWIIEGKTNWEISVILNLSERTVKFHVQQLMRKLGATNRSHLVANALAKGMGR